MKDEAGTREAGGEDETVGEESVGDTARTKARKRTGLEVHTDGGRALGRSGRWKKIESGGKKHKER